MAKSNKYADQIFPDDKQKKANDVIDAVEDAKIELSSAIAAASKQKRRVERELVSAKYSTPFNPLRVLEAQDALTNANDELERLEALQSELF